ncbi:type II toxin-antitoxin system ParD family antitoxin [Tistrella mobilis]|uniref:ribbon-helix-helix domain-containing protein n=1 Tax=Tistrella mobilis TaxID=171437 RepID=UPI0035591545
MASMTVSMPETLREWVQQRIEAGQYASLSDYVRDLIHQDQIRTMAERDAVREKIAEGMASLRAGEGVDGEAFLARLDAELAEMGRQGR